MLVDRKQIDETLNKEVRLKSKNLRIMQMGSLAMVNKRQAMNYDIKKKQQTVPNHQQDKSKNI